MDREYYILNEPFCLRGYEKLSCLSLSSFDEIQKDFPLVTEIGLAKGLTDSSYMKLIDTRLA